jgi:hypothetical protein
LYYQYEDEQTSADLDIGQPRMDNIREIRGLYERLKSRNGERDVRMQNVLAVRQGRMRDVFPDLFPEGPFDKGIVANMVDVAARDLAEVLAPMPSFNCSSSSMVSDRAREFAEKRTKIVNGYVEFSNLQTQMYTATDRYFTYGFVPAMVEIDADQRMPRIQFLDSIGAYPVRDRWGQVSAAFFTFFKTRDELIAMYPHVRSIVDQTPTSGAELIEVVRYHDRFVDMLFMAGGRETAILEKVKNPVGECLVVWTQRPGVDNDTHGQFDDVLAVQVAKARFALLSLEAAQKSVQAPIVLPPDAQELSLGPDAIIRTANGEKIRRVPIEVPQAAFAQQGLMDAELRQGSRYPNARLGEMQGSVVTGRGVESLMSGFDTQVRTGQSMFASSISQLVRLALMVDEKLFGEEMKVLRGNSEGTPYEIKYRPDRDIRGDYTVDVQYGLMAGLDPNRALVFGLQARGDRLISRDFLRRQMPFALNATEEEQRVDIEEMRDALKQAVAGYAQAIPVLAQNGQDPGDILSRLSQIILGRQKGRSIEEVISEAFAPEEEPEPGVEAMGMSPEEQMMAGDPGELPPGEGEGGAAGLSSSGLMRGVAPGQAGMAAGGRPDLQMLLAGLGRGGEANLQASVSRRLPA